MKERWKWDRGVFIPELSKVVCLKWVTDVMSLGDSRVPWLVTSSCPVSMPVVG